MPARDPRIDIDACIATFEGFSPSGRRLAQAIAWMAGGKSRNWKYEKC